MLRKTFSVIFYIFMSLVLYPVFVFVWFGVMAALLYILSKNQTTENVMLVAMGVVGAIRVCSYYKEALATDIAKIDPPGHFLRAIAPIRDKLYKFKGWASYGAGRGMGHFAPF